MALQGIGHFRVRPKTLQFFRVDSGAGDVVISITIIQILQNLLRAPLGRFLRQWVVVFCLAGWSFTAAGGQYIVNTYGADEGLPQNSVMSAVQTPDGYLWIGTLMGGVSRYDGVRFVNFDLEGLPGHGPTQVNRLFADAVGRLWVNTFFGLLRYDEGRFVSEVPKEMSRELRLGRVAFSSSNEVVFTMSQPKLLQGNLNTNGFWTWNFISLPAAANNSFCQFDADGVIWYLRTDNHLGRLKNGALEIVGPENGLPDMTLNVLALDQTGKLWVGADGGLAIWETNHFISVVPTNGPSKISVKGIYPGKKDDLWVLADHKLRRLSDGRWVAETPELKDYPDWKSSWWGGADGNSGLWIIPSRFGLLHVDEQGQVERITTAEGLPSNLLRFLFVDREGLLWTGCDRGGLVKISRPLFHHISKAEGLADTVVTSVCEDMSGVVWIGTASGVLGRWENGVCTNLTLPSRGRYCQNLVVYPDREGKLWIATEGSGVFTYEQGEFKAVPLDLGLAVVRMIHEDHVGRIWIGTKDSLYFLENGKWTLARSQGSDWNDFLGGIAETDDGMLWVGVDGGYLLRYDGKEFKTILLPATIPASRLWTLWPANENGLWIGTYASGLLKFEENKFEQYFLRAGSGWSRVTEGLTDEAGNLWIGTRSGIERVTKAALARWEEWQNMPEHHRIYGRADGLLTIGTSVEFQPRCWKGHDGRLWFGMANGVAYLNPNEAGANLVLPTVVLEETLVDGQSVQPMFLTGGDSPATLKLAPNQRELEIHFTAPTMVAPKLTTLRYRLRNLDDKWTLAGSQRSVHYRALPPGSYTFEANAVNRDGVPSQNTVTLAITVLPHFWQTKSFQFAVIATLIVITGGCVTLVVRRSYRQRLQQAAQQRALELERTRICRDLHDELGVGLTEIGLLGDLVGRKDAVPDQKISGEISGRARDLVASLDEIVWAINPAKDTSAALADYFIRYAQVLLQNAGLRCRLEIEPDSATEHFDANLRHQLFLAFKEALNNVITHAQATEVHIRMGRDNGQWLICVEDNGHGFDKPAQQGSPDGLTGMRERLVKLGGRCEIKSAPGQGTSVTFLLPVKSKSPN